MLFAEVSLAFHAGLMSLSDNLWFYACCLFSLVVASLDSPNFVLKNEHFAWKKKCRGSGWCYLSLEESTLSFGKARKRAQCLNAMMGLSDPSSVQFLFDYYTPFYGSVPGGPIEGQGVSSPPCHNGLCVNGMSKVCSAYSCFCADF